MAVLVLSYLIEDSNNNKPIGFAFLHRFQDEDKIESVHIGYLLAESHWGKGIASQLIKSLIEYYETQTSVKKIIGGVDVNNIPSIKTLTKNGFQLDEQNTSTAFYTYRTGT